MQLDQFRKRITTGVTGTPVTTHIVTQPCAIREIVISVESAGTAWTLTIQDQNSPPFVLIPVFTMAAPTAVVPFIIKFDDPVRMLGGVDAITTGTTAGAVNIWITTDSGQPIPT